MSNAERCIHCGEIIPEGRMICPRCEKESKDFVEVTRCKDCNHYDPIHIRPFLGSCDVWNTVVKDSGFCHHGERKDNG